eukprot:TRINITY_DN30314_c0_g1_i1.p1 TRINITY_DN30314_c0_g1~~TRINITY_DN30314_c0_g1_i1.p1  ORF type:complete len:170 (-),score=25.86 TRINITY_DN30314_c0_g1_i1:137-646(-)
MDSEVSDDQFVDKECDGVGQVPSKAPHAVMKTNYSALKPGMHVQAESFQVWYAAEVLQVSDSKKRSAAPVKVNFLGYSSDSDEWVGASRLRSKALTKPTHVPAAVNASRGLVPPKLSIKGLNRCSATVHRHLRWWSDLTSLVQQRQLMQPRLHRRHHFRWTPRCPTTSL